MTIETSSVGAFVPPDWNAAYAFADSVWAWLGLPLGSSALIPPPGWLRKKSPIVPMNQSANTGHRWREHHMATRTVAGSRLGGAGFEVTGPPWRHQMCGRRRGAYQRVR